jgi:WD40 repeat protein
VIHDPPLPPRRHDAHIPRDLETIVLKAIDKEPSERYASAEALAVDLKHFLEDRPIVARRISLPERAWRWCRRNRVAAALLLVSGLAMMTLVGLGVALGYQSRLKESAVFSQMLLANREWNAGNAARAEEMVDGIPHQYRGWEWHYLKRVCHSESQEISGLFDNQVFGIAFSPDPEGRRIATASLYDGVMIWDASTRQLLRKASGIDGVVASVAFSRDGKRLATGVCQFEQPGKIWIGSPETGHAELTIPAHVGIIWCVAFNPEGTRLASAGDDGRVLIWDTETGALIKPLKDETQAVTSVAFSPDGKYLAEATGTRKEQFPETRPGVVRIWDTSTWREIQTLKKHTGSVNSVAFSPDGRRLASASSDRTVKIWDTETGDEVNTLRGHAGFVVGVAFHPDGKQLVSASEDSTLRIWDIETGATLVFLHGHAASVNGVAYSPDGKRIASVADDKTVKIWDADQPPVARILGGAGRKWFTDVAFSPDGKYLVAANGDRTVTIWDRASHQVQRVLQEHNDPVWGVAYSRDGLIAAACGNVFRAQQACEVRIWNGKTGQLVKSLPVSVNVVWSVAFSPDGHLMATGGGDMQKAPVELEVWDTRTWKVLHKLTGHRLGVDSVTFSPDGQSLASAANDGVVKVWDVRTGRCTRTLPLEGGEKCVWWLAYHPDGQSLATAGTRSLTIWSLATGKKLRDLPGHFGEIRQVAFHPDGQRLASGGRDGTVRIWDVPTGLEILTLREHDGPIEGVAFSPDGRQLATAGRDGTVRIWDGSTWTKGGAP